MGGWVVRLTVGPEEECQVVMPRRGDGALELGSEAAAGMEGDK